jgi:hypothetical protein
LAAVLSSATNASSVTYKAKPLQGIDLQRLLAVRRSSFCELERAPVSVLQGAAAVSARHRSACLLRRSAVHGRTGLSRIDGQRLGLAAAA